MSIVIPVVSTSGAKSTVTMVDPAVSSGTIQAVNVGETSVLSGTDSGNANLIIAQQVVFDAAWTEQSLSFYVKNAAGQLYLGIYDAAGPSGAPKNLIATTAVFTPVANSWNTKPIVSPTPNPAGTYWLVYHPSSNDLSFGATPDSGPFQGMSHTFGALPATFAPTFSGTYHWSFYATVLTTVAPPPPPPPPPPPGTTMASQVSQYGFTWTFDKQYPVGQFITGDWWVVGPVVVKSVTPAPTSAKLAGEVDADLDQVSGGQNSALRRNGSMIPTTVAITQGYDSRSQSYDGSLSVSYPLTLGINRTLISSQSNVRPLNNDAVYSAFQLASEDSNEGGAVNTVMKTAAVLTCLSQVPPADAFRPCYWGTNKPIFTASQLHWDRLLNLPSPASTQTSTVTFDQFARIMQRPWLDHMTANWMGQGLWPQDNQASYGREFARITGAAGLLLNTQGTQDQKRALLYGLVQYGIDLIGMYRGGAGWYPNGGHDPGRKFPIVFAALMFGDDPYFTIDYNSVVSNNFSDDAKTYWGSGTPSFAQPAFYGAKACFQLVEGRAGDSPPYQQKVPPYNDVDQVAENYRTCCNIKGWTAGALTVLLMGAKARWGHDVYFDVIGDWMTVVDPYAANRRGNQRNSWEGTSWDPWVTAMWRTYRTQVPVQADAGLGRMWDVNNSVWVPNPKS